MEAEVINLAVRMEMDSGKGSRSLKRRHGEGGAEFPQDKILLQGTISNLPDRNRQMVTISVAGVEERVQEIRTFQTHFNP